MTIVMQRSMPDLYTSDLIDGRFQVIQSSAIRTNFFIYDHAKDDNLRHRDGTILHFASAELAHAHLAGAPAKSDAKVAKPAREPKAPKVKAEKAPRKARVVTAGEVEVRVRKERKGSKLTVIRNLIREGGTDKEVLARLRANHPNIGYNLSTVSNLRKQMGLA